MAGALRIAVADIGHRGLEQPIKLPRLTQPAQHGPSPGLWGRPWALLTDNDPFLGSEYFNPTFFFLLFFLFPSLPSFFPFLFL